MCEKRFMSECVLREMFNLFYLLILEGPSNIAMSIRYKIHFYEDILIHREVIVYYKDYFYTFSVYRWLDVG